MVDEKSSYSVKLVGSSVKPGMTVFTSSDVFTVPKGVKEIEVFVVGGGGNGSETRNFTGVFGSGGGGGYTKTSRKMVNDYEEINITVGAGCGSSWAIDTDTIFASNGEDGHQGYYHATAYSISYPYTSGGNGGSGGGAGLCTRNIHITNGSIALATKQSPDGASDGGSADSDTAIAPGGWEGSASASGGSGQGTTTRAFGESEGTLYAGGGAGAGFGSGGIGGSGGGGNSNGYGLPGGANTGGGGGGGADGGHHLGPGGSGIAIIRWGY